MSNLTADIQASILKAKNYVDALTIKERMVEFEVETRDWCDA